MKSAYKYIQATVLMFFSLTVDAQKQWTMDECVQYALEHNLNVNRKALESQDARYNYIGRLANIAPRINAGGNYTLNSGRTENENQFVNQTYNSGNVWINFNLPLFAGLQQYHAIASARCLLKSAQYEHEVARNTIKLQVEAAFLLTLQYHELLEAAQMRTNGVRLLEERAAQSVQIGMSSRGEYLLIAAQLAKENDQLATFHGLLSLAERQLMYLLNNDTLKGIKLVKPNIIEENYVMNATADSIYAIAIEQLPEIKSRELQLQSSAHQLKQQWGALSPSLTLSAGYNSWFSEINTNPRGADLPYSYSKQLSDKAANQISLNLNIPIFNRMQTHVNIKRSKIAMLEAKTDLELAKQNLYNEIQKAWLDARGAFEKMNAKEATAASFEEAYRYIEEKFRLGLASATELIVAQSNYSTSAGEHLQARYEYLLRVKVLEFYGH